MEAIDARIAADIEALRSQFADTRTLYRETCALLFFRHGITPTASKLYQYVRKGSMSVPAEVLAQFWADLREKSRVRLDRADLPEPLREEAAELVQSLWARAQTHADALHAEARADFESRMAQMQLELQASEQVRAQAERALEGASGQLAVLNAEIAALRLQVSSAQREAGLAAGEANALRVQLAIARSRGSRKPLGGVPQVPDTGQETLELAPGVKDRDG